MRVSVGEPTVHPFPIRPRPRCRHPAPQIEPETLHPEFDDEPWESQIELVSLSFGQIVPPLEGREKHPEIPRLEKFETLEPPLLPQSLQLEQPWSASNQ